MLVGAGFAGVEAIAELHELTTDALRRHPRLAGLEPRWVLVDRAPGILGQVPEGLARSAARTLGRRGNEILSGVALDAVDATRATLSDGRRIETETIVWTGGVAPNPVLAGLGLPLDDSGRVPVDETLRVAGLPNVWALGDCASVPNAATPGTTDPATCQQARRLARNLHGEPRPYRYRTRGHMASLGRRKGIALVGRLPLRGIAGWLVARGYHLGQMPFMARRARVLADWTVGALFRRDVAELTVRS